MDAGKQVSATDPEREERPQERGHHRSLTVSTSLTSRRYQHFTCDLNKERKKLIIEKNYLAHIEFSFFHPTYYASLGVESFIRSFTHSFHEYLPSSHPAPGLWGPWFRRGSVSGRTEFPHMQWQKRT